MHYRYRDYDTPVKNNLIARGIVYFPVVAALVGLTAWNVGFDNMENTEGPNRDAYMSQFEQTLGDLDARHDQLVAQQNVLKTYQLNNQVEQLLNTGESIVSEKAAAVELPDGFAGLFNNDAKNWLTAVHISPELSEADKDDLLKAFEKNIGEETRAELGFSETDAAVLNETMANMNVAAYKDKPQQLATDLSRETTRYYSDDDNFGRVMLFLLILAAGTGIGGNILRGP
ncbi:MAG: hypothetical protein EP349_06340, partial [Alphaproteobacteria bacterium]